MTLFARRFLLLATILCASTTGAIEFVPEKLPLGPTPRYDHKEIAHEPLNQFCFSFDVDRLVLNKTVAFVNGYKRKPVETPIRQAFAQAGFGETVPELATFQLSKDIVTRWGTRICDGQKHNHVPGQGAFVRKEALAKSLTKFSIEHPEICDQFGVQVDNIHPITYQLSNAADCRKISGLLKEYIDQGGDGTDHAWIMKAYSGGIHGGKGVGLLSFEDMKEIAEGNCMFSTHAKRSLVQRYINPPFLLFQRKFDFRIWVFLAHTRPIIAYMFPNGLVRIATQRYSDDTSERNIHLTNIAVARKQSADSIDKRDFEAEEFVWDLPQFQDYLIEQNIPNTGANYVEGVLLPRMRNILSVVLASAQNKLKKHDAGKKHTHYFSYYGADFILDANLHLWLLEVNPAPNMMDYNAHKRELLPKMWKEIIDTEWQILKWEEENQSISSDKLRQAGVINLFQDIPIPELNSNQDDIVAAP